MLLTIEDLLPSLRCPVTGLTLHDRGEFLEADNGSHRYPKINGIPVLVDFTRSILSETELLKSEGASSMARPQGRSRRWIKRHLLHGGADERAARAATRFLAEAKAVTPEPEVLMIGGGSRGIGTDALYEDRNARLSSFDVYVNDHCPLVADAHAIPFPDGHFDAVWIQYVLEHVLEPWTVAAEISRVLKPGGVLYAETPFLQPVHEGAHDFVRFTHSGHRWLFRDFDEIDSGVAMGIGPAWLVTWEYGVRGLTHSRAAGQAAKLAFSWIAFLERAIPARFRYDAASSYFFLGRKSETQLAASAMTAYYRDRRA